MDVLNYLVLHQGELVTREALERDVWRGALVGYDSVTSTIIKLRRALGDDAQNPKYIETVPKRGYRLIAPVQQPVGDGAGVSSVEPAETEAFQTRSRRKKTGIYGAASLLMIFVVGSALILLRQNGPKPSISHAFSPSNPSIVVIPFENVSDDPELAGNVVEALALKLTPKEKALLSRKTTDNLQAYDLFLEGQRLARITTRESNEAAQSVYKQAIGVDPGYARAYGALAYNMALGYRYGWTDRPTETLARALELAKQSVALDDSIPQTYWSLGFVYMMQREFAKAEEAARKAIDIAPNFGDGYGLLAQIHNNLGEAEKAIDMVAKGEQLNPYFTSDYIYSQGKAYYLLGRYEEAIASLTDSLERNEFSIIPRLYLAACYVQVGRQEDAEWEIDQIRILNSTSTITHTRNALPIGQPEIMNALLDDLRQAGLPE